MREVDSSLIESFRADCLAWMALHHFLPAIYLRELMRTFVEVVSAGKHRLDDLFEEQLIEADHGLDSWIVRPIPVNDSDAHYLQTRIREVVWKYDREAHLNEKSSLKGGDVDAPAMERAILFGHIDFGNAEAALRRMKFSDESSIKVIVDAFRLLSSAVGDRGHVSPPALGVNFEGLPMPLRAVATKHFGDLCADSDRWDWAYALYDMTLGMLAEVETKPQSALVDVIKVMALQSKASALRILRGSSEAASFLKELLQSVKFGEQPLLGLNASHDAVVFESLESDTFSIGPDTRASILFPPTLLSSQDRSAAMTSAVEKKFTAASHQFWALLRRQYALGGSSDVRRTKVDYARNVYSELHYNSDKHRKPESFWMATRLLIESGQVEAAKALEWPVKLLSLYVDESLVEKAIAHTSAYAGSALERLGVLIEVFGAWTINIAPGEDDVAIKMVEALAAFAQQQEVSFNSNRNIAGRSVNLLRTVAQRRPELRSKAASAVFNVIVKRVSEAEHWKTQADALSLAGEFIEVFSDAQASQIVEAILKLLAGMDPTKDVWPLVQPALNVLMSEEMPRLATINPDLGYRIIQSALQFGAGQESEHGRFLFYLQDFDLPSIGGYSLSLDIEKIVNDVRERAKQINSSSAVYNICALLYGSKLSGAQAIWEALDSFRKILSAPSREMPSLTLPVAYQVLNILGARQHQIIEDTGIDKHKFISYMHEILTSLIDLWKRAIDDPMVFAEFSLPPPTKPSSAVIHNWAYGSLSFGESLNAVGQVLEVLKRAETRPELRDSVAMGKVARLGADVGSISADQLLEESRDQFYASLGARLIKLQYLPREARSASIRAIIDKCFRVGPHGLDSSAFLTVYLGESIEIEKDVEYRNYVARLQQSKDIELRLSLFPLLNGLSKKPSHS